MYMYKRQTYTQSISLCINILNSRFQTFPSQISFFFYNICTNSFRVSISFFSYNMNINNVGEICFISAVSFLIKIKINKYENLFTGLYYFFSSRLTRIFPLRLTVKHFCKFSRRNSGNLAPRHSVEKQKSL